MKQSQLNFEQQALLKNLNQKLSGKSPENQLTLIFNWIKQGNVPKPMYLKFLLMSRGVVDFLESGVEKEKVD